MDFITKQARLILPYGMLLTRMFDHVISENLELSNHLNVFYDHVMYPFAAQQERKIRKDYGTRRGRPSTSSSFSFSQPSSSHPVDDDNDGNDEGTSSASTPSPTRFVNSLTNEVPQVFSNPPNIDPNMEPLYTRPTKILNRQVQLRDEQHGEIRSIGNGIKNLWRRKKKGIGGRVGRGDRRTREPVRRINETFRELNGQGNYQGNQGSNQENNGNQNGDVVNDNIRGDVRNVIVNNDQIGCTYKEFLACNLKEYDSEGGAIVYTRWMEKKESVQDMSGCSDNQKVKYSAGSFVDFKTLTREDICPVNEMQKLETEFWNHAMVGAGHAAYTDRFYELARLVPHLVTPENKRIERYSHGLALEIREMVVATEPTTIQKAMQKAGTLTDEAIRNGALNKNTNKRDNDREPSRDRNVRDDNKRTRTGNAFATTTNSVRRENTGHLVKDCRVVPRNVNPINARNPTIAREACFECGGTDHDKSACPRSRGGLLGTKHRDGPLLVIEPSDLGFSYEIEIASGQLVEIDKVIRGGKIEIEGHVFDINFIPFGSESFDNFLPTMAAKFHYHPGKANIVADVLSRKERIKPKRIRSMNMTLQSSIKDKMTERRSDRAFYYLDRIWVPLKGDVRTLTMDEAHKSKYSVHPGDDKMYYDLRDRYWWPGIKKDIVVYINDRLKAARDRQKSYADKRRKPLEFSVGEYVLLKVSPWKGMVRFGKKGKLAPSVHDTFHVSNHKKCLADPTLQVPLDEIQSNAKLNFVEKLVEILEREFKKLKRSRIAIVKLKRELKYPHLFRSSTS
nr:reverse transcriptase domain-containing protein [Tanacetum cinerariifolium]